jgi:hypothetical protein
MGKEPAHGLSGSYKNWSREQFELHDSGAREVGGEIRFFCPFPQCASHQKRRSHRSLNFNIATGLYHCHRCNARGQDPAHWKPYTKPVWVDPREKAKHERQRRQNRVHEIFHPTVKEDDKPLGMFSIGDCMPLAGTPGETYLLSRGLTLDQCDGVLYSPNYGRRKETPERPAFAGVPAVVFPVRSKPSRNTDGSSRDAEGNTDGSAGKLVKGKLVAAQGRIVKPWKEGPKMLTAGCLTSGVYATPGAWERPTAPLAICEAPIDALTLASVGLDAIALCGCHRSLPEWVVSWLLFREVIYIAFDNDEPGNESAARLTEEIKTATFGAANIARLVPDGFKDFNECLMRLGHDGIAASINRDVLGNNRPYLPVEARLPQNVSVDTPARSETTVNYGIDENSPLELSDRLEAPTPEEWQAYFSVRAEASMLRESSRKTDFVDTNSEYYRHWLDLHMASINAEIVRQRGVVNSCDDRDFPLELARLESLLWAKANPAKVAAGFWLDPHELERIDFHGLRQQGAEPLKYAWGILKEKGNK